MFKDFGGFKLNKKKKSNRSLAPIDETEPNNDDDDDAVLGSIRSTEADSSKKTTKKRNLTKFKEKMIGKQMKKIAASASATNTSAPSGSLSGNSDVYTALLKKPKKSLSMKGKMLAKQMKKFAATSASATNTRTKLTHGNSAPSGSLSRNSAPSGSLNGNHDDGTALPKKPNRSLSMKEKIIVKQMKKFSASASTNTRTQRTHGNGAPSGSPSRNNDDYTALPKTPKNSLSIVKQMKNFAAASASTAANTQTRLPRGNNALSGFVSGNDDTALLNQLQMNNKTLSSRCSKLEAQIIIGTTQTVEYVSIAIGLLATFTAYFVYIKTVWWLSDYEQQTRIVMARVVLSVLPIAYDKMNYGVLYRRFQVFAVFVVIVSRIKLARWRAARYTKSDDSKEDNTTNTTTQSQFNVDIITEDDVWEASYEINARFLYSSILRLRGLWTKTAQYISSRADIVPIPYVRELSKLQDEAPATSWEDVRKILDQAGIADRFSNVERAPIASASIGQVHKARLKNSKEDVVIKVQHPSALTLLSDDFVSLKIMAWMVGVLEPEFKFFGILMREWADEAKHEMDFMAEVDNLESAQKAIEAMVSSTPMTTNDLEEGKQRGGVPFSVEIPRPFRALSSRRVLVMSFCEGKRIDDLEQIEMCGVSKEAVMNALSQTCAYMMYVTDIFNGDPHPGNILLRPGVATSLRQDLKSHGFTIVLLDWGLAKRLSKSKRAGFCQMTYSAATFDFGLMMDAFKTLGLKLKRENVAEDMEGVRFMLRDMAPRETAKKRLKAKMKTDRKRFESKKKGERVPVDSNAYPGEFFFFVRTNELLQGLGSKLGVDVKYLDTLKPYAERGLRELNDDCSGRNATRHPDPLETDPVEDLSLQKQIDIVLNDLQRSGKIAGAQVCVVKDDKTLAHAIEGNLGGLKNHLPMRSDTIMVGFSVTKATTATLANRMVQEGYFQLDEPICERIWPQFCPSLIPPTELLGAMYDDAEQVVQKWQWKRSITLRHILTHTTGLWFATPANLTIKNLASCETCSRGFEYDPKKPEDTILPVYKPGTKCTYQYLSFGWLVGGCVIGAYSLRHGIRRTYEEIYDDILGGLHSSEMKKAGFRPCGGGGEAHDMALVETEVDITRVMQMRREAEAMGERMAQTEERGESREEVERAATMKQLMNGIKGREFMLDSRIWNSEDAINANVPAAGGRFSAKALAMLYQELGNGKILSAKTLRDAIMVCATGHGTQLTQGQISFTNDGSNNSPQKSEFGLGYQIIRISGAKDGFAFGHNGVGGSIGFHHVSSNTSIGIMFNKVGGDMGLAQEVIDIISRHLKW